MLQDILTIIFSITTILVAGFSYYLFIQNKILNAANTAINVAEETDKISAEKMRIAIEEIKKILPPGSKIFFTDERIEMLLQVAFDGIELFAKKQLNK